MVAVAREVFSVPEEVETRLWNKYTRDTFELLDKSESTLQVPGFDTYLFDSCMIPFRSYEVFGSGSAVDQH
jgi:hypothetical protein